MKQDIIFQTEEKGIWGWEGYEVSVFSELVRLPPAPHVTSLCVS